MQNILEIINLSKEFNDTVAVNDISFNVKRGQCFGLLGPNGAGKTTTIEMMEGILKPTSGKILFNAQPLGKNYYHNIGIQFQHTAIQDFLTVQETLTMFASFYKKSLSQDYLIETCALQEILNKDTRKLSGGQRQRLLLALAMLNDPDIIFLDEPTTGLDPQSRRNFWQLIENIKSQRKTILLTTHYMEEAETLCDEILIIDKGQIIQQGSPQTMLQQHFSGVIASLPAITSDALNLASVAYNQVKHSLEIESNDIDKTIKHLLENQVPLDGLQVRSPNLEDLFIKLTGHQLRQ
ncbi:ABC transporter ATP-binding protein [Aliikangiella sp. IMCC44653]